MTMTNWAQAAKLEREKAKRRRELPLKEWYKNFKKSLMEWQRDHQREEEFLHNCV